MNNDQGSDREVIIDLRWHRKREEVFERDAWACILCGKSTKKLYVHDETNDLNEGDRVRVMETRPVSKLKRWRLVEVIERAK